MSKIYLNVPTETAWLKDMGMTGPFTSKDFPALQRIAELLKVYQRNIDAALRHEVLCQIFLHCAYILKRGAQPEKLGAKLWPGRLETVRALKAFLEPVARSIEEDFGKQVTEQGRVEDHDGHNLQWYQDKAARRALKLSFRNGLAHRKQIRADGVGFDLTVYDTVQAGDAIEKGMSLYVMDPTGKIYCHGREGELALKHSSFLAGQAVLAAGTMRVEQGVVTQISGKSGHYRPTVQQMLNVLERLRAYQVDLGRLTVYREYYKGNRFAAANPKDFEPCRAVDMIRLRHWPTGVEPYDMHVG